MSWRPEGPSGSTEQEDQLAAGAALVSYLRAMRAHTGLVAAVTLTALVAAVGLLKLEGTNYEATATILVVPVPEEDSAFAGLPLIRTGGPDESRLVETAASLIDSPDAAALAASRIGGSTSPEDVEAATEVEAVPESNIVDVVAKSGSPTRAAELANAYARAALDARAEELAPVVDRAIAATNRALAEVQDPDGTVADELRARRSALAAIDEDPTLSLAQAASTPTSPTGQSRPIVIGFALIAGLLLGAITAVLRELLAPRRLRDESDLADVYPRPVLGRVPNPPRRLARGRRRRVLVAAAGEGMRSLQRRLELRAEDRARVGIDRQAAGNAVLLTSPSRGDGTTEAALALVRALALRGSSVILIDADLRKPAGSQRADRKSDASRRILRREEPLEEALSDFPGVPNARVLDAGGGLRPEEGEQLLARMPDLVADARQRADWVVVDSPPLGDEVDALVLVGTVDDVVVVVRQGHTSLAALARLREVLELVRASAAGYLLVGGPPRIGVADDYQVAEPPPRGRQRTAPARVG